MLASAWEIEPSAKLPTRIVYVDVGHGRFDAVSFGGDIREKLWEWRGPIIVPDALPDDVA